MHESNRQRDFHYLVLMALYPILRFPASFECDDALTCVIREKCQISMETFARNRRQLHLMDHATLQTLIRLTPPNISSTDDHLIFPLSQFEEQILSSLDFMPLLTLLASPDLSGMHRFHILTSLERMCEECARGPELARCGVTRVLVPLIQSSLDDPSTKSAVFRVLVWVAYQVRLDPSINTMISEGLLEAAQDFFDDAGFVSQEDVDRWVDTMISISRTSSLVEITLLPLIKWARQHWKGNQLMAKHIHKLRHIADTFCIIVEPIDDTSWFDAICKLLQLCIQLHS
jgi:hypothetical protein